MSIYPYRVFVSYSRSDYAVAKELVARLENLGLHPVWDQDIDPGNRFSDAIRHGIAHAHVFIPVLTKEGALRPWVHHETGYAMALDVPVFPLAVEQLPDGMITDLHALLVRRDFSDLNDERLMRSIAKLLDRDRRESEATFCVAAAPIMRAEFLGRYTREALRRETEGPFRQAGAMTSFCLPLDPPQSEIWYVRDGLSPRSRALYRFLHEERLAIEEYVRGHGCDLVIDPSIPFTKNGPRARKGRLETLLEFLKDTTVKNVRVAVRKREDAGNLTICGDWYAAETVAPRPGEGYYQTIFTWHAPTVLDKVHEYDRNFELLLRRSGVDAASSRELAIEKVEAAIASIQV